MFDDGQLEIELTGMDLLRCACGLLDRGRFAGRDDWFERQVISGRECKRVCPGFVTKAGRLPRWRNV